MVSALRRFVCVVAWVVPAWCIAQGQEGGELRASKAFEAARKSPLDLHAFLVNMPKGADLHMHLSGAVYAETFLADAVADHLCIHVKALSLEKNVGTTRSAPAQPLCGNGEVNAALALKDQKLYDALIDSFSMRSFVPTPGVSGHDQFFATFGRFQALGKQHMGEWVNEVSTRASVQNEQYLEIMETPRFGAAAKLGYALGWPEVAGTKAVGQMRDASREELAHLRERLLSGGLREEIAEDMKELDGALAERRRLERCDQPEAEPACGVKVRFLAQVLRAFPPQQVFAQTLLYFELASADSNVVGINFVQPEDAYLAMKEYHRQMLMLDYLHSVYPQVHISLHAGELAPGLVPPEGLGFHIRDAVELGHAERIGHGVDVMYERKPKDLLEEMAGKHIMVEINLTSNDVILGVTTNHHSLPEYRAAHVPVALATDDEGVSRIDLTHEYTRAALDFGYGYRDLKTMARTSMEHTFLPGRSLWLRPDDFTQAVAACAGEPLGLNSPGTSCREFLRSSEKASEQWELERRYRAFEDGKK